MNSCLHLLPYLVIAHQTNAVESSGYLVIFVWPRVRQPDVSFVLKVLTCTNRKCWTEYQANLYPAAGQISTASNQTILDPAQDKIDIENTLNTKFSGDDIAHSSLHISQYTKCLHSLAPRPSFTLRSWVWERD